MNDQPLLPLSPKLEKMLEDSWRDNKELYMSLKNERPAPAPHNDPMYTHQNGANHQLIFTYNPHGPDGVTINRLGDQVTVKGIYDSGFLLVYSTVPLADFLRGLGVLQEIEQLQAEVDQLKREVNEYEGRDWRSDGPVYPEVANS